jgi:hypothetical protein
LIVPEQPLEHDGKIKSRDLRIYCSKIYDVYLGFSAEVNIIYPGTIDPYINLNKSQ